MTPVYTESRPHGAGLMTAIRQAAALTADNGSTEPAFDDGSRTFANLGW